MNKSTLPPEFFDHLYRENPDPWGFETRPYEAQKYRATLDSLPKLHYQNGFEIGGSIGVLTQLLAQRCDALLSVDVSEIAQQKAIERCQELSHVRFAIMQVPYAFPQEKFDLIVVSEVGYYLSLDDLFTTKNLILQALKPQGDLILVHWTPKAKDYPLTGDEVHEVFLGSDSLQHLEARREDEYRLDVWTRL